MEKITLDYSNASDFIKDNELENLQERVAEYHKLLHCEIGPMNQYLGWVDLPNNYNKDKIDKIKLAAKQIKKQSDIFIVIGVGGSSLGARAAINMLNHNFYNELSREKRKWPKIYFAGDNISPTYLSDLMNAIEGQDLSINVISKSGTTIESAIAFRELRQYMDSKYGKKNAREKIYITTNGSQGPLKELSNQRGYESFEIPDDVGGRYSILTPVGLLPMAVAGIDIEDVMKGGRQAAKDLSTDDLKRNSAYKYAALRNILYSKGKAIEVMASYEPKLFYFGEWYKQLFGESEGKDRKGIFPTSLIYTRDLHSMGQYVQDGRRDIFETTLNIKNANDNIKIIEDKENLDRLNYLSGKTLSHINQKAMLAAITAHVEGEVPNLIINIPELSAYYFGYLTYFFQKACAMSGYLLGVNPFDQPGVEAYKKNMFNLLGKHDMKGN